MKFHYVYREEFKEIAKIRTDGRTDGRRNPGPGPPPLYAPAQEEKMRRSEEGVAPPPHSNHGLAASIIKTPTLLYFLSLIHI